MNLEKATDKLTAGLGRKLRSSNMKPKACGYMRKVRDCDVAPFVSQISGVRCLHVMYVTLGSPTFSRFYDVPKSPVSLAGSELSVELDV